MVFLLGLSLTTVLFTSQAHALCIPVLQDCSVDASPLPGDTTQPPDETALPQGPIALGQMSKNTFQNAAGTRNYFLYVPAHYDGKTALPVFVVLHGCFQQADQFAADTGMNDLAEKQGFAVIYPEQTYQDNVWKCWNWFKDENLKRGTGELSILAGMVGDVSSKIAVDKKHVYAAGLSAGGAMAANLGACYSDIFSGVGVQSGASFFAANSENEAHAILQSGPTRTPTEMGTAAAQCAGAQAKPLAVVVLQGEKDQFVNPINAQSIVDTFTVMNDLLDDGQLNGSQTNTPIAETQEQKSGGYAYTQSIYGSGSGATAHPMIEKIMINDMQHGWSGSARPGAYADPKGPSAGEKMWMFFSQYVR